MGIRKLTMASALLATLVPCTGLANINLDLRPDTQIATVGSTVYVTLYAVSDSASNQSIGAMDVIINWDPTKLQLVGYTNAGNGYSWFQSGFLLPGGLNSNLSDGDAVWTSFAQPSGPAYATPSGLWVTRFVFQALATTPGTLVTIPSSQGSQTTTVYDGFIPNTDVTGIIDSGANVTIYDHTYPVSAMSIGPGLFLSGAVPGDAQVSDNVYINSRPGPILISTQFPLVVTASTILPSTSATQLTLNVETHATLSGMTHRIEVFNYFTGLYEIASVVGTTLSDSTATVNITTNASDYIHDITGEVRTRLSYKPAGPVLVYPWNVRFDYIAWKLTT